MEREPSTEAIPRYRRLGKAGGGPISPSGGDRLCHVETVRCRLGMSALALALTSEGFNTSNRLRLTVMACKFYRFKELYETGGEAARREISRRKPILDRVCLGAAPPSSELGRRRS